MAAGPKRQSGWKTARHSKLIPPGMACSSVSRTSLGQMRAAIASGLFFATASAFAGSASAFACSASSLAVFNAASASASLRWIVASDSVATGFALLPCSVNLLSGLVRPKLAVRLFPRGRAEPRASKVKMQVYLGFLPKRHGLRVAKTVHLASFPDRCGVQCYWILRLSWPT